MNGLCFSGKIEHAGDVFLFAVQCYYLLTMPFSWLFVRRESVKKNLSFFL